MSLPAQLPPAQPLDLQLDLPLELLGLLFDRAPVGIAVLDRELVLRRCNPTYAELVARYTGTPVDEVVPGVRFADVVPGAEETSGHRFRRALAGESVREEGVRVESRGGVAYFDVALLPLLQEGQVVGVLDVTSDATDRVLSYQLLEQRVAERTQELSSALQENARLYAEEQQRRREAEQRRRVAEAMCGIVAVLNSDQSLAEVLGYIVRLAGHLLGTESAAVYRLQAGGERLVIQSACCVPDDLVSTMAVPVGQGVLARLVRERRALTVPDVGAAAADPSLEPGLRSYLLRVGATYRSLLGVSLVVKGEVYGGLVLYYPERRQFAAEDVDLAARLGDQAALAIENARLRAHAAQAAVAAERSRLARDLHDAVTQTLFSASLIAEVLPRLWERSPDEGRRRTAELRQLTRGALAEMRTLLLELRPAALTEAPLGDLLRQLAEATTGRARLPVAVTVEGQRTLPADVQVALYRIAQEALNNVARHSGAARATVSLRAEPGRVELEVTDDGRGFDPAAVGPESLGLGIMRERAQAAGAALRVESRPEQGTQVRVVWPSRAATASRVPRSGPSGAAGAPREQAGGGEA